MYNVIYIFKIFIVVVSWCNVVGSLEKYFMADDFLTMQGCLREWDRYTQELKRRREIDGINSMRGADLADYENKIAQLERDAGALDNEVAAASKEARDLGAQLVDAEGLLQAKERENQELAQRLQALEQAMAQENLLMLCIAHAFFEVTAQGVRNKAWLNKNCYSLVL